MQQNLTRNGARPVGLCYRRKNNAGTLGDRRAVGLKYSLTSVSYGWRKGERANLRVKDVELMRGVLRIEPSKRGGLVKASQGQRVRVWLLRHHREQMLLWV